MVDNLYLSDEAPFQVNKRAFSISESATGYTLQCSVDCINASGKTSAGSDASWADYSDAIPSGKQHQIIDVPANVWWRLHGNTGVVYVRF